MKSTILTYRGIKGGIAGGGFVSASIRASVMNLQNAASNMGKQSRVRNCGIVRKLQSSSFSFLYMRSITLKKGPKIIIMSVTTG